MASERLDRLCIVIACLLAPNIGSLATKGKGPRFFCKFVTWTHTHKGHRSTFLLIQSLLKCEMEKGVEFRFVGEEERILQLYVQYYYLLCFILYIIGLALVVSHCVAFSLPKALPFPPFYTPLSSNEHLCTSKVSAFRHGLNTYTEKGTCMLLLSSLCFAKCMKKGLARFFKSTRNLSFA